MVEKPKGKRVFTFTFYELDRKKLGIPDDVKVSHKPFSRGVEVPVYVVGADSDRHRGDQVRFAAWFEPLNLLVEHTDIAQLEGIVLARLQGVQEAKLELYMRVEVDTEPSWKTEAGCRLEVAAKFCMVGKRHDDSWVHATPRFLDGRTHPWDPESDEAWDGSWDAMRAKVHVEEGKPEGFASMVPATVENVEAYRVFVRSVNKLGEEVAERFSAKRVKKTLALLAQANKDPMLPFLQGEKDEKKGDEA